MVKLSAFTRKFSVRIRVAPRGSGGNRVPLNLREAASVNFRVAPVGVINDRTIEVAGSNHIPGLCILELQYTDGRLRMKSSRAWCAKPNPCTPVPLDPI